MVKLFLKNFILFFITTFVVVAALTFFYSFIFHGNGAVNWKVSFQFGLILSLVFSLIRLKR